MHTTSYPEAERQVLRGIVSSPSFRRITSLPVFAWQEILLIAGCYAALAASCTLYLSGGVPYLLAMVINALAIYAIFTPLHDATHGSLSSHRGLNDVLGTIAAFPLVPGFTTQLYRYLHMEHHRHTGVPVADPDEVTVGTRMPMRFLAWMFLDLYWFSWYLRRIPQRPAKEVAGALISLSVFVGWHVVWLASPFALEFVLLWLIPQRLGITLMLYLFAGIQHPKGVHQAERPFQATRMFKGGIFSRWGMLSQAQHLMHHMFPAVPYYRYNAVWRLAEPAMREHEIVTGWPFGKLGHPAPAKPSTPASRWLTAEVSAVETVGEEVLSFTLRPVDSDRFPEHGPGAHIDVQVAPDKVRQYSLCGMPGDDRTYRIAVKREANGRGGSRAAHDNLQIGNRIRIGAPRNHFPLGKDHAEVLLVAGGIGITPLLAMAEALHAAGTPFRFHACARSERALPFDAAMRAAPYANQVQRHYDQEPEALAPPLSSRDIPLWRPGMALYMCGPQGFMAHVSSLAEGKGWPTAAIHSESFTNLASDATITAKAFDVVLARSGKTLHVPADRSLLDVLNAHRCAIPAVCTQGLCGTCTCKVKEGEVEHFDVVLQDADRRMGMMTTCVSRAKDSRLVLDL